MKESDKIKHTQVSALMSGTTVKAWYHSAARNAKNVVSQFKKWVVSMCNW
jgi:hypothetical protein